MYKLTLKVTISLFLLCLISISFAMPGDRIEKMEIKSDKSNYNYKKGESYFFGNVQVDQGSTHVTADKLTTKNNKNHQMQEAIAYGIKDKAHFWTTPKPGEEVINATAKIIKFYPLTLNATLIGNVIVKQGENVFQGELIRYNMNDQTIVVPKSNNGRAVLVYNPD